MSRDSSAGFFAGLIIGAVIGAAVALLYAPQPGEETRRVVKEKSKEFKEKAARAAGRVREAVSSKLSEEDV